MNPFEDPKFQPETSETYSSVPHGRSSRLHSKAKLVVDTTNLMNKRKRGTTPKTPPIFVSKTPTTPIPKRRRKLISELRQGITVWKPIRPRPEYCFSPLTAATPTRPKSSLPQIKSPSRDARRRALRSRLIDAHDSDSDDEVSSDSDFLNDLHAENMKEHHKGDDRVHPRLSLSSNRDSVEIREMETNTSPNVRCSPGSSSRQVLGKKLGSMRFEKESSLSPEVMKSFSSLSLSDDMKRKSSSSSQMGESTSVEHENGVHIDEDDSIDLNDSTSEIHPKSIPKAIPEPRKEDRHVRLKVVQNGEDTPTSPATSTSDWSEDMKEDYFDESSIRCPAFIDSPLFFVEKPRVNRRLFHSARG